MLLPLILTLLSAACSMPDPAVGLFFEEDDNSRSLHYLLNPTTDHECSHQFNGLGDYFPIEGSVKLTTAEPPPDDENAQRRKICKKPLVPFGRLTQDNRGIKFWFLRLKVTKLAAGQRLVVVNTNSEGVHKKIIDEGQKIEMTPKSHEYPAIVYLKYRYAVLYWKSTPEAQQFNWVNITASNYARYNDSVNATTQRLLCERYRNTWCERPQAAVCIEPNSCSQNDDCFDEFADPASCLQYHWHGGNLTIAGSSLHTAGWILRNLPWLALGLVPLVLVVALAKICSQKRDLDIDDDYEYKLSCSEPPEQHLQQMESIEEGRGGYRYSSSSSDDNDEGDDEEGEGGPGPYYSYPDPVGAGRSSPPQQRPQQHPLNGVTAASAAAAAEEEGNSLSCGDADASNQDDKTTTEDEIIDEDDDEEEPPPPPPRLLQAAAAAGEPGCGVAVRAAPVGGRALHRLTEVSLEEEEVTDDAPVGEHNDAEEEQLEEEEEEFVNVEYLRLERQRRLDDGADGRIASGEYAQATRPDDGTQSPRASYTRLLSQPSPDTIKELLRPASGGMANGAVGDNDGVVYAQLVLPPPSRGAQQEQRNQAKAASPMLEALELQAVRRVLPPPSVESTAASAPTKGERGSYDLHYIVV